ncbi:hypothetical protein PILCRDRAFT_599921 [Piloderma croceum F 1598]|uniref:Uncharacterized protein n=1 Tax=Piloderma croceum (strain F 1598) TaxID=765440 RepID=A0A0C3FE66_PILCF|nr:hypothetical protein PILCRDRAFT_599921 [Piloderma croceum F 1598]
MSYPGGYPYHEGGYSSMPSTPRASYSWELEQNPNQPGNFQQPEQPQQQQQAQPPPPQQELYESNPPSNPPIQTIQLEERVPIVPSQRREDYELERVQTHSRALPPQRPEGRLAESRGGEFKPHIQVDTSRPGSSSGPASAGSTSGPMRVSPTARGQAQFHPYRRPHGDAGRPRRDTELHVRFAGQGQPQGSMSAPSAAPPRITSLGSTIGSMRCAL